MFYTYVQAWCLGYAVNFLSNGLNFTSIGESQSFWANFVGISSNGAALSFDLKHVGSYLLIVLAINFFFIYKGLRQGIELFAKWAMPILIILGIIIVIRVLTLGTPDAAKPDNNINNGLGFMWNPNKTVLQEYSPAQNKWENKIEVIGSADIAKREALVQSNPTQYRLQEVSFLTQLKRPQLWLAAASQLFLSLCVGTGVITVFSSYMKENDDVVLSNLTSTSANEFCEVALGGLITIPAGYAFLGAAGMVGQGVFGLGFNVLPMVFSQMPFGWVFGFFFFFLLFIAAVSSVLSMLQPGLAFFQESLGWSRNKCLALLFTITLIGTSLVFFFTEDLKLMDTLNFWVGDFLIFVFATIQIILFSWAFGVRRGFEEANRGAAFAIPKLFIPIAKYICPIFMLSIFIFWVLVDVLGIGGNGLSYYIVDLIGSKDHKANIIAWLGIANIVTLFIIYGIFTYKAKAYKNI